MYEEVERTILDLERKASELALELLAMMGFTNAQLKQAGVEATTMSL